MTPWECYVDTANRAERLLKLATGLANRRKRRIRADWKKSFLTLMHWRQSSAIERVDGHDAILVLRPESDLTHSDFTAEALSPDVISAP